MYYKLLQNGQAVRIVTRTNPQRAFGADVISRIEASVKGEKDHLAGSIREAIDGMIRELAEQA